MCPVFFLSRINDLNGNEFQVVAVAARNLKRAEEFAQKHCIPKVYSSYEELAKDPEIGMGSTVLYITHEYTVKCMHKLR